jgi:hypothetical protein
MFFVFYIFLLVNICLFSIDFPSWVNICFATMKKNQVKLFHLNKYLFPLVNMYSISVIFSPIQWKFSPLIDLMLSDSFLFKCLLFSF